MSRHDITPARRAAVAVEDRRGIRARVLLMVPGETVRGWGCVVVEAWDKVVPVNSRAGSKNRRYKVEFTEQERTKLGTWHTKFYGWEMRTGYPDEVGMTADTLALLKRAADFFASV